MFKNKHFQSIHNPFFSLLFQIQLLYHFTVDSNFIINYSDAPAKIWFITL
jgi:hypothetical protein